MAELFILFVVLFSLSTLDPVKFTSFEDAPSETTKQVSSLSQKEIKAELKGIVDNLPKDLQTQLIVSHDPRGVTLEIDGGLCFSSGSIDLEDEIKLLLDKTAVLMSSPKDNRGIVITLNSDSGQIQDDDFDVVRASKIINYLINNYNVSSKRLSLEVYPNKPEVDTIRTLKKGPERNKINLIFETH